MKLKLEICIILILIISTGAILTLEAQTDSVKYLYKSHMSRLRTLSQSELSFQQSEREFQLLIDTLILVAETKEFVELIKEDGEDVREVYGGLYRLDQDYNKSLFYYRELLKEEPDKKKSKNILGTTVEVLMERYSYKRPYYIDFLFGKTSKCSHLCIHENDEQNTQIEFLIEIREIELAQMLMLPNIGSISFQDELNWDQDIFINLIQAQYSGDEIYPSLSVLG